MIFFAGLHSMTQTPLRRTSPSNITRNRSILQHSSKSMLWTFPDMEFTLYPSYAWITATFCHCARSCVICPATEQRWEDFRVYAQANAMNLFCTVAHTSISIRVTESVISSETKHFEDCITRSDRSREQPCRSRHNLHND